MFVKATQIQRRLWNGLLVLVGLVAMEGCRRAEYIPGTGNYLQVSLNESDTESYGSVGFNRTNQPTQPSGAEMECLFTDGSILRGPSQGSGAIVCYLPFPNDPTIQQVTTTKTFTQSDFLALPGASGSNRKPATGRYLISKPHPGYHWGCKATFQTKLLPTQFRFVQKGISTEWIKIDLITQ